jgi:hypothetical protein|tara:strand:- start:1061 stop:1222 length:162 start_codon:yes stop_codon:yes gene_type:complete
MTNALLFEQISEMADTLISYKPKFESDEDLEEYIYSINEAVLDLEKIQEQLGE